MAEAQLPALPFDVSRMAAALLQSARESVPSVGFLRMDKSGTWIFGIDAEEIEEDQLFAVNPSGFGHGYVCWTNETVPTAAKLGESYVPLIEPLPQNGPVPPTGRGWEFQLGFALKGYKGTQDGVDMVYRTSSVGGKRAISMLSKQVGMKLNAYDVNKKADDIVPLVTLSSDSYPHKRYGKIFIPIINIEKWVKLPTNATQADLEDTPEERKSTKRSKRR
jgi:hypothetical protein